MPGLMWLIRLRKNPGRKKFNWDPERQLSSFMNGRAAAATAAIVSCPGGRPTGSRADWPVALYSCGRVVRDFKREVTFNPRQHWFYKIVQTDHVQCLGEIPKFVDWGYIRSIFRSWYTPGEFVWCDGPFYLVKQPQQKWACDFHDDAPSLSLGNWGHFLNLIIFSEWKNDQFQYLELEDKGGASSWKSHAHFCWGCFTR